MHIDYMSVIHHRLVRMVSVPLLVLLVAAMATTAYAAPGDLDPSFGSGGIVITDIGTNYDVINDVTIQSDGKIVVVGANPLTSLLARYNTNGSLDTTFDGDGIADSGQGGFDLAIQPDGRIITAGSDGDGFKLSRYNSDGSLDTNFGSSGIVSHFTCLNYNQNRAVALQDDGKIVSAGYCTDENWDVFSVVLARYNVDGSMDTTFGTDGVVVTSGPAYPDSLGYVYSLALQADGKIVVAGSGGGTDQVKFMLLRYNADGTLDTTFDTDGMVFTDPSTERDVIHAVTLQSDGKIITAGYISSSAYNFDFAVTRYNANGTLDGSFGTNGIVITPVGTSYDEATSVALQTDGKILAAGTARGANQDFALVRYNINGSLDTSFSSDGIVTTYVEWASVGGVAIQPDGRIVVAGDTWDGSDSDFALARYVANNSPLGPTLLAPANGSTVGDSTPTFSWMKSMFPRGDYQIQVDDNIAFDNPIIDTMTPGMGYPPSYAPNTALADGVYYWRVQEQMSDDWSEIWLLTIDTSPTAPTGLIAATLSATQVYLFWGDQSSNETEFRIERSDDGGAWAQIGTVAANTSDFIDPGTTCGHSYHYQVFAYDADSSDISAPSNTASLSLPSCIPADEEMDLLFAVSGMAFVDHAEQDGFSSVAVQPDGRIIVGDNQGLLARYNPDGTLDTTFGTQGIVTTEIISWVDGIALQPDGKIVAASSVQDMIVIRFNSDGALDTTFGGGGGYVITDISGDGGTDWAEDILVQPDGKIVLIGTTLDYNGSGYDHGFAAVRYNEDGSLDPAFGDNGIVITHFGNEEALSGALQPDGKLLLGGYNNSHFAVTRLNTDGSLDTTFGAGGQATAILGDLDIGQDLIVLTDGKIVLGGYSITSQNGGDLALARFNPNGSLDNSFGGDGTVITTLEDSSDRINSLALMPGGWLVTGGVSDDDIALAIYRLDGSLDETFGTDGIVYVEVGDNARANALAIQGTNQFVVAGIGDNNSLLTRFRFASADLALTKMVSPSGTVNPGVALTYVLTLVNNGPANVTNRTILDAALRDAVDSGLLQFVSATTSQGSFDVSTGQWTGIDLAFGQTATATITVTAAGMPNTSVNLTNTASVVPGLFTDPNPANNTATATIQISWPDPIFINTGNPAGGCVETTWGAEDPVLGRDYTWGVVPANWERLGVGYDWDLVNYDWSEGNRGTHFIRNQETAMIPLSAPGQNLLGCRTSTSTLIGSSFTYRFFDLLPGRWRMVLAFAPTASDRIGYRYLRVETQSGNTTWQPLPGMNRFDMIDAIQTAGFDPFLHFINPPGVGNDYYNIHYIIKTFDTVTVGVSNQLWVRFVRVGGRPNYPAHVNGVGIEYLGP